MKKQNTKYPLDNSGIIHMAVRKKGFCNTFRLCVTLTETVDPRLLQEALDTVTPRFPTMAAGIRNGVFRHWVVPVEAPAKILPDTGVLVYMPPEELKKCAMRVLYRDTQIAVEFFHSLTDGHGGFQFLKSLLAEYLKLAHGVECAPDAKLLMADTPMEAAETEDSFARYAGKQKARRDHTQSYQMIGKWSQTSRIHVTTAIFPLKPLLKTAHDYRVTLTTLLTAVMASSIMELQTRQTSGKECRTVQVMVPVNLRKHFPSRSIRNFTLYALPGIRPGEEKLPFPCLLAKVDRQLKEQLSRDFLQAMISGNVRMERSPVFSRLPLGIKCAGLRIGFHFFGARNSSISLSNLGQLVFPEALRPYIRRVGFLLTPRLCGPYNCGLASYDGQLYLNFTRTCPEPELERVFLKKCAELGQEPVVEVDGVAADGFLPSCTA